MTSTARSSTDGAGTVPTDEATNKLTVQQRRAAWKRFVLQTGLIMLFAAVQEKIKQLMPRCFGKHLNLTKKKGIEPGVPQTKKKMQERPVSRIINGQVVGTPLPAGKGRATVPADQCAHPQASMAPRGNAKEGSLKQLWWTCKLCQSRWVRFHFVKPTGETNKDEVLTIGKHRGKTYGEVLANHASFAHWAVMTVENDEENASAELKRFAKWVQREQGAISQPATEEEKDSEKEEAEDSQSAMSEVSSEADWTAP